MVEVDDAKLAEYIIEQTLHHGDVTLPQTAYEGEYGEYEFDLDARLSDLSPSECGVSVEEDHILVEGTIDATYSVRTSRGSRMHPPEYRNEQVTIGVAIHYPFPDLGIPEAHGELY